MAESKSSFSFWEDTVAIMALFNIAAAYPLYEILGRNAEFFVFKRTTPLELIIAVLILSFLIPFSFVLLLRLLSLLGYWPHIIVRGVLIAVFVALILLPPWNRQNLLAPTLNVLLMSLISIGIAAGHFRYSWIRTFVVFLAPAIVAIPVFFLTRPMITKIVFSREPLIPYYKVDSNVSIVMIIFDEFPLTSLLNEQRTIDALRFPNFARLADDATWYRNATSVAERTTDSVPAILTGKYLAKSKLPSVQDYPDNLFTLLGQSYEIEAVETVTGLCPPVFDKEEHASVAAKSVSLFSDLYVIYLHLIIPSPWNESLPPISQTWGNFEYSAWQSQANPKLMSDAGKQLSTFIDSLKRTQRPVFYFYHAMLPHRPWKYLPSGREYGPATVDGMILRHEKWADDESLVKEGYRRHLLQVGYTDYLLGKLIDKLKEENLYDSSIIIVTADHGIGFEKGRYYRFVTDTNIRDILGVPLFIKVPLQNIGSVNDWNVQTVDILPTIADALDIDIPWKTDGRSVLTADPATHQKIAYVMYGREQRKFESHLSNQGFTLQFKISSFGTGSFDKRFYLNGICDEMVGKSVQLQNSIPTESKWILFNSEKFENVDPDSEYVPATIAGRILNSDGTQLKLAITVNGVIQSITTSAQLNKDFESFNVIVPERAFKKGTNRIDLYRLHSCDSELQFIPQVAKR